MGTTFTKYVTEKRMNLARKLLQDQNLSIQEVADQTGYGDYFQFSKVFKRENGVTPGKYRNSL